MKINEEHNEFLIIKKFTSPNGPIYDASVKVLREVFTAQEEDIVAAYSDQRWKEVRSQRDKLLSECDWIVAKAIDTGTSVPAVWQEYRQALRDITTQSDPDEIDWPTKPSQ